ncbi:hypothetical protein AB1Y20_022301 [Prymnesium parvum]|uniref:TAFII28-like protein domain-containing protein n=1 Tax=Prymnesium parvum TaxID=97485 RepID=A0AB34JIE9_PRYPA
MPPREAEAAENEDEPAQLDDDGEEGDRFERLERRRAEYAKLGERYADFIRCATSEQLDRFDHYKRAKLPRAAMRKLMSEALGHSTERMAIVLASAAKMFVGEMVEVSKARMAAAGEEGPIRPHHLRQAYRTLQQKGVVPSSTRYRKTLFWRADAGA